MTSSDSLKPLLCVNVNHERLEKILHFKGRHTEKHALDWKEAFCCKRSFLQYDFWSFSCYFHNVQYNILNHCRVTEYVIIISHSHSFVCVVLLSNIMPVPDPNTLLLLPDLPLCLILMLFFCLELFLHFLLLWMMAH